MAQVRVIVRGVPELREALARIRAPGNRAVLDRALTKSALLVQRIAAREKIIAGGVTGRGRARTIAPPHPSQLTSRTGAGRRSIRVNRDDLPFAIEIGSDLTYMAVHEFGGTFSVTRKRPVSGGTVTYSATYPPRPFLGPALDDAAQQFPAIFAAEFQREVER